MPNAIPIPGISQPVVVPGAGALTFSRFQRDLAGNTQLGIDPVITGLVLGQPRRSRLFGEDLFRTVSTPALAFRYQKFGLEGFELRDARRPMRSEIQHSDLRTSWESKSLERWSWQAEADRDELANAAAASGVIGSNLGLRERYTNLARRIVDISLEVNRSKVALDPDSYSASPDLDTTLAAGAEFNGASGDSRAAIRLLAGRLAASAGVQITDIDVHLTHASFEAAQDDPTFVARRGNFATSVADGAELASYWGVGQVVVGDAHYSPAEGQHESVWKDVTILRVSPTLSGYDTSEGQLDSFVRFNWSGGAGLAVNSYYIESRTTWAFPWEAYEYADAVAITNAAIIRNCHKDIA